MSSPVDRAVQGKIDNLRKGRQHCKMRMAAYDSEIEMIERSKASYNTRITDAVDRMRPQIRNVFEEFVALVIESQGLNPNETVYEADKLFRKALVGLVTDLGPGDRLLK